MKSDFNRGSSHADRVLFYGQQSFSMITLPVFNSSQKTGYSALLEVMYGFSFVDFLLLTKSNH